MPAFAAAHLSSIHSALPWRRWAPWLAVSLLLHGVLMVWLQPAPAVFKLSSPPAVVSVRLQQPVQAPAAVAEANAPPTPTEPARMGTPSATPTAAAAMPDTATTTPPTPAPTFARPLPEAGSPGADVLPVPFAPAAQWPYELVFDGERGDALLNWQREGLGYQLTLERRTVQRVLPTWQSNGTVSPAGLAPDGFTSRGRRGQGVSLAVDQAKRSVTGPSGTLPVPPGIQDRLSWMLQLSAVLSAQPDARAIELSVVDWRGRPQLWRLDWVGEATISLSDGTPRRTQHWRRQELGAAQAEIELWLDPDLGYLPLRIVHTVRGDDRWELQLSPSGLPPLHTLPQLPTERDQSPTPIAR